ncbi:MAG: PQQ-dependent sugar dehydrogenase [Candidatus Eremiobacteraeota bacterium]|nr:PQQ-dependent sugar dehydrogenase [Candidatus Eremiobacteraeota bacterium]
MKATFACVVSVMFAAGCGGGATGTGGTAATAAPRSTQPVSSASCSGATLTVASPGPAPTTPAGLSVAGGLKIQTVATIAGARELAALPNGDVLVGTSSSTLYLVPHAEEPSGAGAPIAFATLPDADAAGVTFDRSSCTIFVGTTNGIYSTPYRDGDTAAEQMTKIASVRSSSSGGHSTTSVAVSNGTLYASVGSSCNACTETDPTRATIQQMQRSGASMSARAVHIRNAIALTVDPQSGHLWAGDAGQDDLPAGHPYEFFDDVSTHAGVADYGWPQCEENQQSYGSGATCANEVVPLVELPAYSTIIGAAFYPSSATGTYALPAIYRGGAFLAVHGSWHQVNGRYAAVPQVVFVPMNGDMPQTSVNWSDPTLQWSSFVTGFQLPDGTTRIGRPTGVTVGSQGSVFIADDDAGAVYRVRP